MVAKTRFLSDRAFPPLLTVRARSSVQIKITNALGSDGLPDDISLSGIFVYTFKPKEISEPIHRAKNKNNKLMVPILKLTGFNDDQTENIALDTTEREMLQCLKKSDSIETEHESLSTRRDSLKELTLLNSSTELTNRNIAIQNQKKHSYTKEMIELEDGFQTLISSVFYAMFKKMFHSTVFEALQNYILQKIEWEIKTKTWPSIS
ncbi:hypothetical protein HELRODRAFT_167690 [Helobdella robusta]|uniref:Uncharacterized protein n=1 Tax=Helobdella robusta TaxID=6412 RepID=T1EZP1_HELRO|nr:hypothetical protein HELRODRAFT_167690 [Helobdella robusta]ESO09872.1 hypothetical protein HELRODRAFT_167690 [Helobdella robusta]